MLRTKSIFDKIEAVDGLRVSVMSRHTLNDGITKDPRLVPGAFDMHIAELAPPSSLVGAWYKNKMNWEEFTRLYLAHLGKAEPSKRMETLIRIALKSNVTILCVEHRWENCHRFILANALRDAEPKLRIEHV